MPTQKMKKKQIKFITNELWILAWNASVQRANIFKKDRNPTSRVGSKFRKDVIEFIDKTIIPQYANGCNEDQHYKNIDDLIAYANKVDPGILSESGYKYGVAQKLLNLALKYYWCQGLVMEPPHCPVDRIVISNTRYSNEINWTQITEKAQYHKIIEEIKVLANEKGKSIPLWELEIFERR
ncbi:MAG: hypothetical protein A3K23_03960 [Desulfobacca sp. RBG_16_58_9]|nr:MAG: hypothetical protein A3K23_03960 [Desulfobacca sp. RBG_16_58_9]